MTDIGFTENEEDLEQETMEALQHEAVNIYSEVGIFLPYPEATWWAFEEPDFDIIEKVRKNLEDMEEDLVIAPVIIKRKERHLFEARFEFPQYEREFKYDEAVFYGEDVFGWIDFLSGVPYGCLEKMGIVGEVLSKDNIIGVKNEENKAAPPLPEELFLDVGGCSLIFNKIWIAYKNVLPFEKGLSGHSKPKHDWWTRINIVETDENELTPDKFVESKFTPGEFIGTAIWIFPNLPWGWQDTHPFIFSGNRIETVYYTSAKVLEVIDDVTYLVSYNNKDIEAKSSDYAIYKVDDRVTILKGAEHEEDSMTWEDLKDFDAELWSIIPAIFYYEEEEG